MVNAEALRMIWNRVVLNNFPDVPDNLDMTNWFGNWVWNWTGIENAQLDQDVRTRRRRVELLHKELLLVQQQ